MRVELLLAPGCPNASAARAVLTGCLHRLGVHADVQERVGDFPSPTILVDGVDVMSDWTGGPSVQACRLDMPTEARVWAALHRRASPGHRLAG
jgi:hypothetical protein